MLKSIEKIKKFGVFQNFTKHAGIKEFAEKNLIYGWNYSGKTTLSRLFAKLELKSPHPDFADCEFTFNVGVDGITEKNLHECNLSVRVFNSDFVKNNLFFDTGSCNAILLLGKESEEAQRKIDVLSIRIRKSQERVRVINRTIDTYSEKIKAEKTKAAQFIRQRLKLDPYTATHLGQDLLAVGILDTQLLSDKDLENAIELALTPDSRKPAEVKGIFAAPSIEAIHKEATTILAATPTFSNTIKHLEDNPEIERWVESGLNLHTEAGSCEFCGNQVTTERLDAFRSHFSKDLADHKTKVERLLQRVEAAELKLEWPKSSEINPQFRETYEKVTAPLTGHMRAYNDAIRTLAKEVKAKVENSRKAMDPSPLAEGLEKLIIDTVKAINEVIRENNKLATNFIEERKVARQKARYHYVQQFADEQKNIGLDDKKSVLVKRSDRIKVFSQRLQVEVEKLQAEISQAQQGREKINDRLVSMLGSQAVQIKVTKDNSGQERFQLVRRNGVVAKNLSDGERTAIAFSYFLTKLQELKPDEFKETIVYIDDPISSLDGNHIFQVTAAINDMFFHKIRKADGNETWVTACKQLFVSTHNFEFFHLMRELKPDGKNAARLYLIKRVAGGDSELCDMPASLAKYSSEYQYLFDSLYQFHISVDKAAHQQLMILPNALRRFVELYTVSRIPSTYGETVDQRASELFGKERAKSILKFLHTFSHGNTIERVAGNNELIFLLEQTVKDVFDELQEKDERHWKALIAAVQV